MTEAEQSIAVKRKVAVTKPRACDGSPSEAYSPKRRQSDHAVKEASPPLYIPSRKNSCDQSSSCAESSQHKESRVVTCDTAEPALRREDYGELISRSRREELLRAIGIDRDSSHQVESAISPQRDKRQQERDREFTHKREVKEDKSSRGVKNFQITAHVVSSDSGSVISDRHDNRKRQHSRSPEPRQTLSLTVSPSSNKDAKTSITSRLGKVVVERRGSCDYEDAQKTVKASSDHSESNSWQRDVREDIVSGGKSHPVGTHMGSDERIISSSSREAIREHNEASVTSVQPGQTYDNIRGNSSPDSRVVQSSDYVENSEDNNKEEDVISSRGMAIDELLNKPLKEVTGVAGKIRSHKSSEDTDDLAKMIDEDLGPELLEGTQNDEFTLDLDDDDISHVVADIETEAVNASEKVDRKSGIRFIVTLDGVDEGQFNSDDSSNIFERRKCPHSSATTLPVAPVVASNSNQLQLNQKLILNLLASQSRNASQNLSQQVQTLATTPTAISKLTPPKIQPFSISLKDSDDEHDDSKEEKPQASRQSFFHQAVVAEEENEASALKRAKMSERCKFWPACAAGASCEFHHPTTRCKTFPNCRFGEKCLFIHPNCKFDSRCARPDCPFTHTSRRPALAGAAHVIALPQPHFIVSPTPPRPHYATFLGSSYPSPQAVCRYFPNCQNVNCSYAHPKPCKFGASCKSSGCQFYHHSQPARDKLKWQAQCEQPKTQSGILLDSVKMEPAVKKPRSSTLPSNSATVSSTSQ